MIRAAARVGLAVMMVAVGVLHFVEPDPFVMIVPGYLPWPLALVLISGAFEILGGLGLLVERTRRVASWGLIALYVAVFPANVWMATKGVQPPGMELSEVGAWARLPLQAVLIAWAWWVGRPDRRPRDSNADVATGARGCRDARGA